MVSGPRKSGELRFIASAIVTRGFPCGSAGIESTCSAGDLGSIPGLGRSPGAGKGYPLQYSGLQNSMDCIESDMSERLSLFTYIYLHIFTFAM